MNTSFVFLANGFEEVEALTPVDIMRRAGMEVVTVSINDTLEAEGAHGVTVKADALISEVNLNNAEWRNARRKQPCRVQTSHQRSYRAKF